MIGVYLLSGTALSKTSPLSNMGVTTKISFFLQLSTITKGNTTMAIINIIMFNTAKATILIHQTVTFFF